jgi:hypothetical protein
VAPLPTFIIIGAQKSATRWLRMNLGAHPDIFAVPREIGFFNARSRYEQGLGWYREQFADWGGEPVVGEASPAYLMWRQRPEEVAGRIHGNVPDVRLIAILRNPVDRAASALLHHVQLGRVPEGTGLLEWVRAQPPEEDRLGLVSGGWYAASLRPYRQRFGDDLLVLLHDDLAGDAGAVYTAAVRHVGAEPSFVPGRVEQVRFSYREKLAGSGGEDGGGDDAAGDVSLDDRRELYEYFRGDVGELEQMLGRDLGMWDPDRGG